MNEFRAQIFGKRQAETTQLLGDKRPLGARADALKSVAIPRSEGRSADMREGDRHRLAAEQVAVTYKRKRHEVDLVNLSGGGAMIAGALAPKLWDRLDLHLGDGATIECAVRWIKDGRIGLEFAHETGIDCSDEQRAALLRAVITRSFPQSSVSVSLPQAPEPSTPAMARESDEDDHRDNKRHPLIWSGQIHYDYSTTPVRLRNISRTGALIECALELPVGAEPLLDLGDAGSIFAVVTWSAGDKAGLQFQSDFDLDQLAAARPDLAPMQWDAPSYLRTAGEPDSPWAEKWNRLSVDELGQQLDGFLKR